MTREFKKTLLEAYERSKAVLGEPTAYEKTFRMPHMHEFVEAVVKLYAEHGSWENVKEGQYLDIASVEHAIGRRRTYEIQDEIGKRFFPRDKLPRIQVVRKLRNRRLQYMITDIIKSELEQRNLNASRYFDLLASTVSGAESPDASTSDRLKVLEKLEEFMPEVRPEKKSVTEEMELDWSLDEGDRKEQKSITARRKYELPENQPGDPD